MPDCETARTNSTTAVVDATCVHAQSIEIVRDGGRCNMSTSINIFAYNCAEGLCGISQLPNKGPSSSK